MIPYASCLCFSQTGNVRFRRRQWQLVSSSLEGNSRLVLESTEDNALCFRVVEQSEEEESEKDEEGNRSIRPTQSEADLLEALKSCDTTSLFSGPLVSYQKRKTRKPVIVSDICISNVLDDTYTGFTQDLLSKCDQWSFNTFNLDISTGGHSLSALMVHLFQAYGFVNTFNLDVVKLWQCFNVIESAYHSHNPYHNSVHAADVTQAMHCFLQEKKISSHLTHVEAMASIIAAVAHDLDHPGVNQAFLVATSNHLVNLYQNSSVLENHHWRSAISCLLKSGVFDHLDKETWTEIQNHIRSLILATDITRQKEFLARFKGYLHSGELDMEEKQYRHFALQIALKCADLCNPCRPWTISQKWSYQVCQEFYRQGAYERQLNLPVTPNCDVSRSTVARIQADFFKFVVSPLFETWNFFLSSPLSNKLLKNLRYNHSEWEKKALQVSSELGLETLSPSLESRLQETHLTSLFSKIHEEVETEEEEQNESNRKSTSLQLEIYTAEELNPVTTVLSLSSNANTVQLRRVQPKSYSVCPPLVNAFSETSNLANKNSMCSGEGCNNKKATVEDCEGESGCHGQSCNTNSGCSPHTSCNEDSGCTGQSCNEKSGCSGQSCNDDSGCTDQSCNEKSGCTGQSCNEDSGCTGQSCNEDSGCTGQSYNEDSRCTGQSYNEDSRCIGQSSNEDSGCTGQFCNEDSGCTGLACNEDSGCTSQVCCSESGCSSQACIDDSGCTGVACSEDSGCTGDVCSEDVGCTSKGCNEDKTLNKNDESSSDSECPNGCCSPSSDHCNEIQDTVSSPDKNSSHSYLPETFSMKQGTTHLIQNNNGCHFPRKHVSGLFYALASPYKRKRPNHFQDRDIHNRTVSDFNKKESMIDSRNETSTSWCLRISHSLSEERTKQLIPDFDSSIVSVQRTSSSLTQQFMGRRSSAPMTFGNSMLTSGIDVVESKGGLRGGADDGITIRRWSVPTEPLYVIPVDSHAQEINQKVSTSSAINCGHPAKGLVRRHSIGLLESFLGVQPSESGNGSEANGSRFTASAQRSFEMKRLIGQISSDTESNLNSELHESFLTCIHPSQQSGKRRGSLPVEVPLALMCHVSPVRKSPKLPRHSSCDESSTTLNKIRADCHQKKTLCLDQTRTQGTHGELLNMLIGPAGMLAFQGDINMVPGSTNLSLFNAQGLPRRFSGGLELLSGFWRSRTTVEPFSSQQQTFSVAQQLRVPRQPCSLDSANHSDWLYCSRSDEARRICTNVLSSPSRSSGIHREHLMCQQRRGSVPLDISFLSVSSGKYDL